MPPLNKSLLRDWTLGILPSNRVEEYAMNAAAQGADGCEPFARVGGQEKLTGNMQRDIMKALGQPSGSCPFFWMDVPYAGRAQIVAHPFILTHELLASIYKDRQDLFRDAICAQDENLEEHAHCGQASRPQARRRGTVRSSWPSRRRTSSDET